MTINENSSDAEKMGADEALEARFSPILHLAEGSLADTHQEMSQVVVGSRFILPVLQCQPPQNSTDFTK